MRYATNHEIPFVCQINLPEAAQQLWREAFNEAWTRSDDVTNGVERHRLAQSHAFAEVRRCFSRDSQTGRWAAIAATAPVQKKVARTRRRSAAMPLALAPAMMAPGLS